MDGHTHKPNCFGWRTNIGFHISGCLLYTSIANGILLLLRYTEQWYAWFVTLLLYTALYIISGSYIMLITVAAMLVNTCYGFGKWLLYTRSRRQKQEESFSPASPDRKSVV